MAFRTDISVDWTVSPRRVTVAAPSAALTVQDLYDTLRQLEDDILNLVHSSIVSAAGKEPLGGANAVGVTVTLQDARVSFAARTIPTETGTVTTANTAGTMLTDSAATFVTNGVTVGAWIVNLTDGSTATATSVVSQTELRCEKLAGGTENDFDLTDSYKVYNVVQCEISGGNLVAVDSAGSSMSAIFPTMGTQVVLVRSTSPAISGAADADLATIKTRTALIPALV